MDYKSIFRRDYKPSGLEYLEMALLAACLLMHHVSWASISVDGRQALQFEPFVLFGDTFMYAVYALFIGTIAMKFVGRFTGMTLLAVVYLGSLVYGAHAAFTETRETLEQMQAAAGVAEGLSGMFGSFAGSTTRGTGMVGHSFSMNSAYVIIGVMSGLLALCLLISWIISMHRLATKHRVMLTRGYYIDMLGYALIVVLSFFALKTFGASEYERLSEVIAVQGVAVTLFLAAASISLFMLAINAVVVGLVELLRERSGKRMVAWSLGLALVLLFLFLVLNLLIRLSASYMPDRITDLLKDSIISITGIHAILMCELLFLSAIVTCLLRAVYFRFFQLRQGKITEGNVQGKTTDDTILEGEESVNESLVESYEADDTTKKWYYIASGITAALLAGGIALYFTVGGSDSGIFAGKPLSEVFPPIKKVVEVNVETANLRTGPSTDSPVALDPMNAQDGVKYEVNQGMRLAVVEETDEWYKLASKDRKGAATYIKKSLCRDLVTGVIPQEKVYSDWVNRNSECGGGVSVVRQPKGNRLVVSYTHIECDADELLLGVYQDGAYLFYYSIPVTSLAYEEHNTGVSIKKESAESLFYEGYYGKDMTRKVKFEWGEYEELDWAKVPEDKLAEIFGQAISEGVKNVKILTAHDIEEALNQKAEEDYGSLSGFSYVVDDGEFGLELYAEIEEKKEDTGIASGAETLVIIDQGDYDGDGEKEALVFEWGGGNAVDPPYLVYYDSSLQVFKKVEGFMDVYDSSSIKVEEWNGKISFLATIGLRKDRYVYEYRQLKQVERMVPDIGKRVATTSVKQLFGDSEEIEEKIANIDVNSDGISDEVTFSHNGSHAMDWGRSMLLMKINMGEQVLDLSEGKGMTGGTFTFLESTTNGIPDILCDDAWLYKWNGEKYECQE